MSFDARKVAGEMLLRQKRDGWVIDLDYLAENLWKAYEAGRAEVIEKWRASTD